MIAFQFELAISLTSGRGVLNEAVGISAREFGEACVR
jgi:hypothetical protein